MATLILGPEHDIAAFTSKASYRPAPLRSVHYKSSAKALEATDGVVLIRVPVRGDGPDIDGVLPADVVSKAVKSKQIPKLTIVESSDYPNTNVCIPTEASVLTFAIQASTLERMGAYARRHSKDGRVVFHMTDDMSAIRFEIHTLNDPATGVLMPMRPR